MGTFEHLLVSETNGVVTVRINREPDRNALNRGLMEELTEFAQKYRTKASVRAIVLRGADRFFSSGADLSSFNADRGKPQSSSARPNLMDMREAILAGPDMCKAWEELEPVTIAAIEGYCVGGAAALVLCCDFRILGDGAMMRLPEVPLGINMSWRTLPRLVSIAGPSRAKRFTIFGESAQAKTLLNWGMADEVVNTGGAYDEAMRWAEKVAVLPPLPVRMTKETVNATANALNHATSFMDRDQYLLTFMSEDFKEGVTAFFEKRDPKFEGK